MSKMGNYVVWCEDGSIRMDIKRLKPSDGINSSAIDDLYERVKKLEKNEVIDANAIDTIFDRLTVLENEMIDKDLRISKLEQEVIEKL